MGRYDQLQSGESYMNRFVVMGRVTHQQVETKGLQAQMVPDVLVMQGSPRIRIVIANRMDY